MDLSEPLFPEVIVVDALMGAGKTVFATALMDDIARSFDNIFSDGAHRFIYITPFLEEVERVKDGLRQFSGQLAFDPKAKSGKKLNHLNELISEGKNIVSTHALFRHVDEGTYLALDGYRYTLMIDEVAEWVERYSISTNDLKMLYAQGMLRVDPATKRVIWMDPEGSYAGKFDELRSLCRQGKIVSSRLGNDGEPVLLLWQFPIEMLARFSKVYIFTHLFDGSDMAAYLRLHGVPVNKMTLSEDHTLVPYDSLIEKKRLDAVRSLVTVIDDPGLNAVGLKRGKENPLSVSWYKSDIQNGGLKLKQLRDATRKFFKHRVCTPSKLNLWSTYKAYQPKLKGDGYSKSFEACNSRATNRYKDRCSLAYLVNLYHHPYIRGYFEDAGAAINEEFFALLTMTQWVWRSRIRERKPITLYIPSERMRKLFLDWLSGHLPAAPEEWRPYSLSATLAV